MFRLEVRKGGCWHTGIRQYSTFHEAKIRQGELTALGMQVRVITL